MTAVCPLGRSSGRRAAGCDACVLGLLPRNRAGVCRYAAKARGTARAHRIRGRDLDMVRACAGLRQNAGCGRPSADRLQKAGVPLVLATAWGDNGAEANLTSALLGMQLYAEFMYTGTYDAGSLARRFACCCGADAQAFLDLSLFNPCPACARALRPVNAAKILLYQDPLVQLFAADTAGLAMSAHYTELEARYTRYADENPAFEPLFRFYPFGPRAGRQMPWHEQAAQAVRRGILLWRHALPKPCPGPLRRRRRFAPHGARCGKPLTGPRASRSSTSAWAAWPQGFPPPQRACARLPRASARTSRAFRSRLALYAAPGRHAVRQLRGGGDRLRLASSVLMRAASGRAVIRKKERTNYHGQTRYLLPSAAWASAG